MAHVISKPTKPNSTLWRHGAGHYFIHSSPRPRVHDRCVPACMGFVRRCMHSGTDFAARGPPQLVNEFPSRNRLWLKDRNSLPLRLKQPPTSLLRRRDSRICLTAGVLILGATDRTLPSSGVYIRWNRYQLSLRVVH